MVHQLVTELCAGTTAPLPCNMQCCAVVTNQCLADTYFLGFSWLSALYWVRRMLVFAVNLSRSSRPKRSRKLNGNERTNHADLINSPWKCHVGRLSEVRARWFHWDWNLESSRSSFADWFSVVSLLAQTSDKEESQNTIFDTKQLKQ